MIAAQVDGNDTLTFDTAKEFLLTYSGFSFSMSKIEAIQLMRRMENLKYPQHKLNLHHQWIVLIEKICRLFERHLKYCKANFFEVVNILVLKLLLVLVLILFMSN